MSSSDIEPAEIRNLIRVKELVRRSENPNPIIVVIIILVILMSFYCMFLTCKKSITGNWVDNTNSNQYFISHNKYLNTINISIGSSLYDGIIDGNTLYININAKINIGVVLNKNYIKWTNGDIWSRY